MIYIMGSLRNPQVPNIVRAMRLSGLDVWAEWYAAGEYADDAWRDYEKSQGRSFTEALYEGDAARHVFDFDREHLEAADAAVLLAPAGKSAHLELGWVLGQGKPGYILLDDPDRWDVMYLFSTGVFTSLVDLIDALS